MLDIKTTVEISGNEALDPIDFTPLMESLSQLLVSQTQDRIATQNQSPTGEKWHPWSSKYAKTRKSNHSLLISGGTLLQSIYGQSTENEAIAGSNMLYARIHQKGGQTGRNHAATIPARPYLGLSEDNKAEVRSVVLDYLQHHQK